MNLTKDNRIGLIFLIIAAALLLLPSIAHAQEKYNTNIYIFWGEGCPHCEREKLFLDELQQEYPEIKIKSYEVSRNRENAELFIEMAQAFGIRASGVPTTFVNDKVWVGYADYMKQEIEDKIAYCIENNCTDPADKIKKESGNGIEIVEHPESVSKFGDLDEHGNMVLPVIGTVNVSSMPVWFFTLIISFIDGFNPCSLWVITFLLGIAIYSGSRKRIVAVGITYLLVAALVYGLFIIGLLNIFLYVGFISWIRAIVVIFALTFAAVNIKDFFWYKKGFSFTIPDKFKPKMFKNIKEVMDPRKSMVSMIFATIIMALGITLVELPCTAGFPVIWTSILAIQGISMLSIYFAVLLAIYLLIYFSIEMIIFFGTVFTLKKTKFEEKHGRLLKLVGGAIMLVLGLVFAFKPEYMESVFSTMVIFASTIAASVIFGILYDKIIGYDEKNAKKVCTACRIIGLDEKEAKEQTGEESGKPPAEQSAEEPETQENKEENKEE